MKIIDTPISGLYVIEPKIFGDSRGFFFESYNRATFEKYGIQYDFKQDNYAKSSYGVIRGLHFQKEPYAQTKLVSVTRGKVLDVVVDLRRSSPTFLQSFKVELSCENRKQILVPKGFAHGYSVLSNEAELSYKCDDFYHPESEGGIRFDDPQLKIDWGIPEDKAILSDKDLKLPLLSAGESPFFE